MNLAEMAGFHLKSAHLGGGQNQAQRCVENEFV